ncbi:MAG: transcription antitermination factor NusB [Rickettsiaceae bacterium]
MINQQISTKSIARIAAIQTLYQFSSSKGDTDINTILLQMKEFYKDTGFKSDHDINATSKLKLRPSYSYLDELVKYTYDNLSIIDEVITTLLTKEWTINNIPMLLHAVLRVAICELNYFPETPRKVIINEYTDIANDMLDENEIGFVNSALHNYSQSRSK